MARHRSMPPRCSLVKGKLLCAVCEEHPRSCPECEPLREPERAICETGRCMLSRASSERVWVHGQVCVSAAARKHGKPGSWGIESSFSLSRAGAHGIKKKSCAGDSRAAIHLLFIRKEALTRAREAGLTELPAGVRLPR